MTTEQKPVPTAQRITINIAFEALAEKINKVLEKNNRNNRKWQAGYNGNGQKVVRIPEKSEKKYIAYTTAGKSVTQPFNLVNDSTLEFILNDTNSNTEAFNPQWLNILQTYPDLTLVNNSGTEVTYQVGLPTHVTDPDEDDVDITIQFSYQGEEFVVTWDPQIIVEV